MLKLYKMVVVWKDYESPPPPPPPPSPGSSVYYLLLMFITQVLVKYNIKSYLWLKIKLHFTQ